MREDKALKSNKNFAYDENLTYINMCSLERRLYFLLSSLRTALSFGADDTSKYRS